MTNQSENETITKAVEALKESRKRLALYAQPEKSPWEKETFDQIDEALTALQEQPAPVVAKLIDVLDSLSGLYRPRSAAWDIEAVAAMQQASRILSALQPSPAREEAPDKYEAAKRRIWGGAPVAATDTQLEAEALVKQLRQLNDDYTEVLEDNPPRCPDVADLYYLKGRLATAAAFIARHHLGESK